MPGVRGHNTLPFIVPVIAEHNSYGRRGSRNGRVMVRGMDIPVGSAENRYAFLPGLRGYA
ncbi:MAG: hypothetical protein LLF84_04255 [Methanoregulaceae archaeon]|nr:hypothetical protein [Methanoregulaceae archaeon]